MTPTTDPGHDRDYPALLDRLRAWARGDLRHEAAVQLLIEHGHWLRRDDFTTRCVRVGYADEHGGELMLAWIRFDDAVELVEAGPAGLPASSSERQVLGLAASLAGWHPVGWSLDELLTGLDQANTGRVLDAVAHTTGHPDAKRNH